MQRRKQEHPSFDPEETEALMSWAVTNASELAPLSIEVQVYQLWFIAALSSRSDLDQSPLRDSMTLFGDLLSCSRIELFEAGRRVLIQELHRLT